MENITLPVMASWLQHIQIPYTVVDKDHQPCIDMVEIAIAPTEALALIELGRKLEQNCSRLKSAA